MIKEAKFAEMFSEDMTINHNIAKMPSFISDRDFVFVGCTRRLSNGTLLILAKSITEHENVPVNGKIVRGSVDNGCIILEPKQEGTFCSYITNVDPKGSIPVYAVNLASVKQAFNVLRIRQRINEVLKAQ